MDTKRVVIDYFDAKRPEVLRGLATKLALFVLIAVVPGGLPLVLSAYLYQRSTRTASAARIHRWCATVLRAGASVFDTGYRTLGHWEQTP